VYTREASIDDLHTILRFAMRLHDVGYFENHTLNPEKLARHLLQHVMDNGYTILMLIDGEEPIGFISGEVVDLFFTDELVAQERMLWVEPRHRSLKAVRTLIDAFEEWGKKHGASALHMAIANGYHVEKMAKLLTRYGFTPIGGYFVR